MKEIKKRVSRVSLANASSRSRHFVNGPANTGREGFDDYCWSNNGGGRRNEVSRMETLSTDSVPLCWSSRKAFVVSRSLCSLTCFSLSLSLPFETIEKAMTRSWSWKNTDRNVNSIVDAKTNCCKCSPWRRNCISKYFQYGWFVLVQPTYLRFLRLRSHFRIYIYRKD